MQTTNYNQEKGDRGDFTHGVYYFELYSVRRLFVGFVNAVLML